MQAEEVSSEHVRARPNFLLLTAIALVAGLICGGIAIALGSFFAYPPELAAKISNPNANLDPEVVRGWDHKLLYQNTILNGTLVGAVLAGIFACQAAGASRFLFGALLGAALGAAGGALGAFTWWTLFSEKILLGNGGDATTLAAIANSILWALIGVATAVAAVRGQGRMNAAIAGLTGGILGAWLFMLVTVFAFPGARTDLPIPARMEGTPWLLARVLWALVPALMIGLLVSRSLSGSGHAPAGESAREIDESEEDAKSEKAEG